jgi:hypothetical protein
MYINTDLGFNGGMHKHAKVGQLMILVQKVKVGEK